MESGMNAIECKTKDKWLKAREGLLTASDAAAALGLSPWESPTALYARKVGLAESKEENESMRWGSALQGGIGQRFADVSGREVTPAPEFTIFLHPEHPWLGATLDFFQRDTEKGEGVLETKATGMPWEDEPPVYYQVQAIIQGAITAKSLVTLAAFQGLRKPPAWADIPANDNFLKRAIGKLDEFHWRVQNRKPPSVLDDGSEATREALKVLYPKETIASVALPPDALTWVKDLERLKRSKKAVEEQIRARENSIKAAIGDAEYGLLADGRAYRWRVEPRAGYTVEPSEPRVLRLMKGIQ